MFKKISPLFPIKNLYLKKSFSSKNDLNYCVQLVKQKDFENFLSGLILPKEAREIFFILRAYNIEISSIIDHVPKNTIQAGKIRFDYWKGIFDDIYEAKYNNFDSPISRCLNKICIQNNLTKHWFLRHINLRQQELTLNGFKSINELEDFAEHGHSSLNYLFLEGIGIANENLEFASSHLGVCTGIVNLLRGLNYHNSNNFSIFPEEIAQKHGLSDSILFNGPKNHIELEILKNATHDIASQAYSHLQRAKKIIEEQNPESYQFLLYQSIGSSLYLERLEKKHDFNPILSSNENLSDFMLHFYLKILKARLFNKM